MTKKQDKTLTLSNIEESVGSRLGVSGWHVVTQDSITSFGDVTNDPDPNHVDPEYAAKQGTFGEPVAFGFQTLSLLTFLSKEADIHPEGVDEDINYGFNSIRLLTPVPAGSRIRASFDLKRVRERGERRKILELAVIVEVEGKDKPALVADWLVMCGAKK